MAGLGRKTFASGEVLTAANTQGYLMDQSVMVFADAAARTSALASPTEGMHSYLSDTDSTEVYDGSAWGAAGGKVLQVVQASTSTVVSTTSTSYVTTGLTAAITPSTTSSKILIMSNNTALISTSAQMYVTIFRGTVAGTNLGPTEGMGKIYSASGNVIGTMSLNYLDSPSTTSSQTYTIGMKTTGASGDMQHANTQGTMILIEVAA